MYKLDKENDFKFIACGDTVPIDFCVSGNKVTINYNKTSTDYVNALNNSHVALISEIINSSINTQVSPDYNGNYIIHGNYRGTEYSLKLNKSGLPLKITSKNSDLIADFTNIKEVNNGN